MSTTITRVCAWCGETFAAQRIDATYCRESHRKAAARARAVSSPPEPPPGGVEGPVYRATLAELQLVGRHLSGRGATALNLAALLDGGATGTAAASLARAHVYAMEAAMRGATTTEPDVLDELRARRVERRARLAGGAS